jgi:transposase
MTWYMGIDLHARTFTIAVKDRDGNELFVETYETSCEKLREIVGSMSGKKRVVLEESTLASWAYRVLQGCGASVVVADPYQNRLIGKDPKMDDKKAARKLADLLRWGQIHPVHHTADLARQGFRELVLMYLDTTRDRTRVKNRLKSKFRQHGVQCRRADVYLAESRAKWRKKLESPEAQLQVDLLWADLDHYAEKSERLRRLIQQRAKGNDVIRRLRAVPGIGLIRASTFYVLIDTPHRFADKRKLWSYCGIGLEGRESGESKEPDRLVRRFNPRLKDVAKGAAASAVAARNNPYAEAYVDYLQRKPKKATSARLKVARSIISTMYELWRRGTEYDPQYRREARSWGNQTDRDPVG